MRNKVKYIGLGEYPNINQINTFRKSVSSNMSLEDKSQMFLFFKTSKGIKKRKLF